MILLLAVSVHASSNTTTEYDLSSTAEYTPVSGVTLNISYNLKGWIEGSSARPGETVEWGFGVRDSEVKLSLSIDKWTIKESWSETVDFEVGSRYEIDVPIPGVSLVLEFDTLGDFDVVTGQANLEIEEIEFNRSGEKSYVLDISNQADGGDKIGVRGKIYPRANVGLEIDLLVASKTFEKSISMPAMEPSLAKTVYIPCKIEVETRPVDGGFIERNPAKELYEKGEEVTITAHPESGYKFDHWLGSVSGTEKTITIKMNTDKNIKAHFTKVEEGGIGISQTLLIVVAIVVASIVIGVAIYMSRRPR